MAPGEVPNPERNAKPDQELGALDEALRDFRLSVHAWSEAVYARPRTVVELGRRRSWRLAAGWALGCVLVAGGASTGIWQHHRQEVRISADRLAERQRLAVQEQARQAEEDLLAKVDSDVSRAVPAAMEPLGQLMVEDETE
jgi:hypothetical protein